MRISLFILLLSFVFASCKQDKKLEVDLKLSYYPLKKNHSVSYQVDSFVFSDASLPAILVDTISIQVKEVIGDAFLDNAGFTNYEIFRYKRKTSSDAWQFDRLWFAAYRDGSLHKVEDNLRFIKLSLPPREAKNWDGNSFIATGEDEFEYLAGWDYTYNFIDEAFSINGFEFDSTLAIQHIDEENLISKRFSVEYYSKNIGLVFKEMMILEKQNINNGWDKPEKGVIVRYSVIDFSN